VGELNFANGDNYVGYFLEDNYDGEGKLKMKNGDVYDGEWEGGKKHGKGILIEAGP